SAPQREFASRRISDIKEFLSFAPSKP
ncbi:MAG: hypothetical protein JWN53_2129, partial [Gemmatimonadetes bacterium]|nr:hypothetical protein [Gemmatimonadota bacterium]